MNVDLNPLVAAVAALVIALTPVAVGYLTIQVEALKSRMGLHELQAQMDRQQVAKAVDDVRDTIRGTAAATQAVVKDRRLP